VSATAITPAPQSSAVPVPASDAPAPRAVIDYDFQTILAAPPRQRFVLWLMVALIAAAAVGLSVARVNMIVSANGRLVTSESEIVIQPIETSVVRSVKVKMGEQVKKGEILATLDPTFTQADETELSAKLRNLQATYDRINAEMNGRDYDPANPNPDEATQADIFRKRKEEFAARLNSAERKVAEYRADLAAHKTEAQGLAEQINLATQSEGIYRTLVAGALASKLKLIDTTRSLVDARSRLATNLGEQARLNQQISEALAERDAFVSEWKRKLAEEMAKTRSDRDGTAAQFAKAKLRRELAVLRAPEDGTVLEVADRPAGSVIREAEPLMRLVPANAPLVAEIEVDTRDVARLHIGDHVTIKFEALPWQQFGLAYGTLKTIAPDTSEDRDEKADAANMTEPGMKNQVHESPIHYRARVWLTHTKFRNLPQGFELRPGMKVVGDIKVGRRSVLEYILNPITRVVSESLREP
jgi:membrane fusion protein, hemolysin D